jgi:DNA-binding NtrC family response regulator
MGAKRILIVEDMPDWRNQLQATLRRDGYNITTVPSYGEALAELRRNPYELALVDLRLSPADESNRDGMELLRDLAKAKIPAVVVTGYGGVELARKAIDQYHAFDFMEKQTLDLNRLREVIKAAFKKVKGKEKELRELRERVFRGEVITFDVPEDAVNPLLREKRERYGQDE